MYNNNLKMKFKLRSTLKKHKLSYFKNHKQHATQHGGVDFKKIAFLAAATILKLVGNVASVDSVKEIRSNLSQQPEYVDLNASLQETFVDLYGDARCKPSDMFQYEIKRDLAYEQTKIFNANAQHKQQAFFQPAGTMSAIDINQGYTPALYDQSRGTSIIQPTNHNAVGQAPTTKKRKHRANLQINKAPSPPNPFAIFEENKFKLENCNTIATEFNTNLNAFIRLVKDTDELEIDEYIKNLEHQLKELNDKINQSKEQTKYVQLIPPVLVSMNEIYKLIKLKLRDLSTAYEMKSTAARTRGLSSKEKQILLLANKIIIDHFKTSGIINMRNQPIGNVMRLETIGSASSDMEIEVDDIVKSAVLPIDAETQQVATRRAIVQSILASKDNRLIANAYKQSPSHIKSYVQYDVNGSNSDVDIFGRSRPKKIATSQNRLPFRSQSYNKTRKPHKYSKTKKTTGKSSKTTTRKISKYGLTSKRRHS